MAILSSLQRLSQSKWMRLGVVAALVTASGQFTLSERTPSKTDNLCKIFQEKPHWYAASQQAAKKWRGNLHVPMAMMFHESGFRSQVRTPIRYKWGWLPVGRVSSAYGYSQAINSTWARYERQTGNVQRWRNQFADAIDFMQWYMQQTKRINQIPKSDAYRQYLNYHEGQHGYNKQAWTKKIWLMGVARKVERRAKRYAGQLKSCQLVSK